MKTPLETGHIDRIIKDICEYIEFSDSAEVKQDITYLLGVLENDAKRALQKALSITEPLLQYIDSPSDVVYESNLGISEDDDNYLLSKSICAALDILLTIKCYHYLNNVNFEDERYAFSEMIDKLRDKILIYRGIELEEDAAIIKHQQALGGSKSIKIPRAICALIGCAIDHDINKKPRDIWNRILKLIREKDGRFPVVLKGKRYVIYTHEDEISEDLYLMEQSEDTISPLKMKYHSAFEDHVRAAKKYYRKKKKDSE
jgi:hypothetical protein